MSKVVNGKIQPKQVSNSKLNGPALTHMRDVAFGLKTQMEIHKVMDRAERMRDDDTLLLKAEEKRLRKAAKRKG